MWHLPKQRQLVSQLCVTVLGSTDLTRASGFALLSCLSPRVSHYSGQCRMFLVTGQTATISLLPWLWKELDGGTGFFTCCWEYPPVACHAKSFPCWVSCQGQILSINCHLWCLLVAVHQISVCSCSREGSCNKSHTHSSIRWYLPCSLPIPILAVLISRLQGEVGDHFIFLTDTWLMTCGCSCLGNVRSMTLKSGQNLAQGKEKDNQESVGLVCVVSFLLRQISWKWRP